MNVLIGIGTYTQEDDGVGLRIAEHIDEKGLATNFKVVEMGGNLTNILFYCNADTENILVVDCVKMGAQPGDYRFFSRDEVETLKTVDTLSTHGGDVLKVIDLGAQLNYPLPSIYFLGIEPKSLSDEMELSSVLKEKFQDYIDVACDFMKNLS
jgi:hydrogenase maturation protease